jgi:hypothetical protein
MCLLELLEATRTWILWIILLRIEYMCLVMDVMACLNFECVFTWILRAYLVEFWM